MLKNCNTKQQTKGSFKLKQQQFAKAHLYLLHLDIKKNQIT